MELINDAGGVPAWFWSIVPPHGSPTAPTGTFTLKATFRLQPGGPAVLVPEEDEPDQFAADLHIDDDDARALIYPADTAWFKPNADLLLHGTCHTPDQTPATSCTVEFTVGPHRKRLAVIGDRVWQKGLLGRRMTDPLPFRTMPLHWEYAFGGPDYDQNPVGKGATPLVDENGDEVHPLPNIESPDRLISSARQRPAPAGFGPLRQLGPERMGKIGTFDKEWEDHHWPGFPPDMDWTFFNAAPVDQQVPGYLRGDEPLRMVNMHRRHAIYESQLPGVRPRWFIRDLVPGPDADPTAGDAGEPEEDDDAMQGEVRFREVPLNLDTLWVDMDRERLILVWRGVVPVLSRKFKRMLEQWVLFEPLGGVRRDAGFYEGAWDRRKQELEQEEAEEEEVPEVESVPPIEPMDMSDMKKEVGEAEKEVAEANAQADRIQAQSTATAQNAPGSPPPAPPADPSANAAATAAGLGQIAKAKPKVKLPPAPKAADFDVSKQEKEFDALEAEEHAPVEPVEEDEGEEEWNRDFVMEHAEDGGSFDGEDLSGLDLSGLDLAGLSFREALLADTDLVGSRLEGADLTGAVLVDARMTTANLARCKLAGADLTRAVMSKANLTGAILDEAELAEARLVEADLARVSAVACSAVGANLSGAKARESDWSAAVLDEAIVENADFRDSKLAETSMAGAKAAGVDLMGCEMTTFRGGDGADFRKAVLRNVNAPDSAWDGSQLDEANLFEANLENADFEDASLRGAILSRAFLRCCRFCECRMDGVQLIQSDMFQATVEGSSLTGAQLQGANLFETEFLEADVSGAVFTDANIKRTRLA